MITFRQPFKGEFIITQHYGEVIPGVTYQGKPHTGIDYGCPQWTPILASAEGTVMAAGWDLTGYGFRVILRHSDGRATLYGHLDSISVSMGQHVAQGEEIGLSGSTGKATGPHLHFEARRIWNDYSSHFNPMQLPLMTVDDSIQQPAVSSQQEEEKKLEPGIYRVDCGAAYVRNWETLQREKMVYFGELVYVFGQNKKENGLTFYYIGGGSAMAAADNEGTILLEKYYGEK